MKIDACPTIDLARAAGGREPDALAREVDAALTSIGFFVVTNHGVPPGVVDRMTDACGQFFDSPLDSKLAIRSTAKGSQRGYVPFGDSALAYTFGASSPPDLKESFAMGPLDPPPRALASSTAFYAPNVWPAGRAEFRDAVSAFYRAMEGLTLELLRVFAAALSLPMDFFDARFDGHNSTLRAFNYPAQQVAPLPGQLRAGEHTDYGILTLLLADGAPGGLQVRTRAGEWLDIVPPTGSFVVNIGDLMMYWTNDRWLSNVHRVANPPAERAEAARRQSVAYFANPREDVRVECFSSCVAAGDLPRHSPVLAGEHRMKKIRAAAEQRAIVERTLVQ